MSHLSQDQILMCILDRSTPDEVQHARECPQCRAELERFQLPVATFRVAMQDWSDGESVPGLGEVSGFLARPRRFADPVWRWAPACLALMLLTGIPIYVQQQKLYQAEVVDAPHPDELLMDAVNIHLSRTMPSPMEPIMALIPEEQTFIQSGGNQ